MPPTRVAPYNGQARQTAKKKKGPVLTDEEKKQRREAQLARQKLLDDGTQEIINAHDDLVESLAKATGATAHYIKQRVGAQSTLKSTRAPSGYNSWVAEEMATVNSGK